MGILDIILGLLLLYGFIKGLKNGLIIELASLIALVAGLYGALHFSYILGDYLHQNWDQSISTMNTVAFIITFFIIVILVNLLAKLLTKIVDIAMLGLPNKIIGAVFGTLKVAVVLGALLIFFDKSNRQLGFIKEESIQESKLYAPIKEIGSLVFGWALQEIPSLEKEQGKPSSSKTQTDII